MATIGFAGVDGVTKEMGINEQAEQTVVRELQARQPA